LAVEWATKLTEHIPDEFMTKSDTESPLPFGTDSFFSGNMFKKRCYEKMFIDGVTKFFEGVKTEYMADLIDYLDYKVWSKTKRNVCVDQLLEIVESECVTSFLSSGVKVDTLKNICDNMYLVAETNSIPNLVDCILFGRSYLADSGSDDENDDANIKIPRKISEECSKSDLHFFRVEDLKEFLNSNNMISNGRKAEMVNRILLFFKDKEKAKKNV